MKKRTNFKKRLDDLLFYGYIAALFGAMATPFIHWIMNPELTHMELFLKFWWLKLIVIVSLPLVIYIGDKPKKKTDEATLKRLQRKLEKQENCDHKWKIGVYVKYKKRSG